MKLELLSRLNAERAARRTSIIVTDIESGEQRLVDQDTIARDPLGPLLEVHLARGRSALIEQEGRQVFLTVQEPPMKVAVIGAVHISQAMVPMMKQLDLSVTVIDPRTAFATPDRFPDVHLVAEWPETVLPSLELDPYTAVVALTHDPKIDDPAIMAALRSQCFYIGALGSRKTHARRVERMTAAGFTELDLSRIHAPIGLDIGATSPAEIAVSILAEIISAFRKRRRGAA